MIVFQNARFYKIRPFVNDNHLFTIVNDNPVLTIVNDDPSLTMVYDDASLTIVNEDNRAEENDLKGIGFRS